MLIFSAENRHNIHVVLYIGLISKGGGAVMTKTTPQAQSSLHISQSVVETIVTETIREIDGVYALAALQEKGAGMVRTAFAGDAVQIDLGVILSLTARLRDVCEQIQQSVKDAVQTMAGITVSKVNVYVTGIAAKEE